MLPQDDLYFKMQVYDILMINVLDKYELNKNNDLISQRVSWAYPETLNEMCRNACKILILSGLKVLVTGKKYNNVLNT